MQMTRNNLGLNRDVVLAVFQEFREQQKALEEQRERREKEKLEALKKKEKHEQSAVASSEVKQRLQVSRLICSHLCC